MSIWSVMPWLAAAASLVICPIVVFWRQRQLFRRIDQMLDRAMEPDFQESDFSESALSSVEAKLCRFLAAKATLTRQVQKEQSCTKTLLSDISHQTKTPLANLLLYAQLLAEKPLPQDLRGAVDALQAQAQKLHFLIGSLLKLSRLEAGIIAVRPQVQPIGPVLQAVSEQIGPAARQKNVRVCLQESDSLACFDGKWTEEALYNLLDNAVKYTPAGGRVAVSSTCYELFVRIDVCDTGIGIREDEQSKVFQRFYRSADAAQEEGVGIGLFLVRQIVTAQGGYVRVRSKESCGSTFSVFLPRS